VSTALCDLDAEFSVFRWSGQNRSAAREIAANDLLDHLRQAQQAFPQAAHVLVCHSHGGTVAYEALRRGERSPQAGPAPTAILCMGTPFALIRRTTIVEARTNVAAAWSALLGVIFALAVLLSNVVGTLWLLLGCVLAHAYVGFLAFKYNSKTKDIMERLARHRAEKPVRRTKIALFRATRDEASLVIGLAQSPQGLYGLIHLKGIKPVNLAAAAFKFLALFGLALVIANASLAALERLVHGAAPAELKMFAVPVVAFGLIGVAHLLCGAAVAPAVGHTRIKDWLRTAVEVETSPPEATCEMTSYSYLGVLEAKGGLRHAIYDHSAVQRDIADTIRRILVGQSAECVNNVWQLGVREDFRPIELH
jgi:hypothetical protein